ncbi:MAG: hypothetical protein KIT72_04540 [Polyangiaceae bacterium]|nr:hypothetical protein [Polyangiaceae bacterium]MCW5789671.1 hypothetical protein [Polyangiaceae bacterium]
MEPTDPQQAAPVSPEREADASGRVWVLLSGPASSLAPPTCCGCCGDPRAACHRVEAPRGSKSHAETITVPLCEACLEHTSASATRALSLGLATALVGLGLGAGLPLALEQAADGGFVRLSAIGWFSRWGLFLVPSLVTLLIGALGLWREARRVGRPPTPTCARSVLLGEPLIAWRGARALSVASRRLAEELVRLSPGLARIEATERRHGARRLATWAFGVAWVLTALVSLGSFYAHRPRLQILNLSGESLVVEVDGELLPPIIPTSQESPHAGLELRLAAGRRQLRVLRSGEELAALEVTLLGGARHLYAPLSDDHCLWLERVSYGGGRGATPPGIVRTPLWNSLQFWTFVEPIDVWLAPPPTPTETRAASSGGQVVALRQARCQDAPAAARREAAD